MTIASRLAEVRARIERAARDAGRDPSLVKLVAVSKTKGPEAVREAYAAGQRAFGENYAQELAAKAEALADLPGVEWHFIGHLQTNKARVVAKHAHVVHTVDSAALARELGKRVARGGARRTAAGAHRGERRGRGAEGGGGAERDRGGDARGRRRSPSLALRGLMTMPPAGDLDAARRVFETLVSLRNLHGGPAVLPELSMGMSDDLEVAIACGATLVRVGTAIFGARALTGSTRRRAVTRRVEAVAHRAAGARPSPGRLASRDAPGPRDSRPPRRWRPAGLGGCGPRARSRASARGDSPSSSVARSACSSAPAASPSASSTSASSTCARRRARGDLERRPRARPRAAAQLTEAPLGHGGRHPRRPRRVQRREPPRARRDVREVLGDADCAARRTLCTCELRRGLVDREARGHAPRPPGPTRAPTARSPRAARAPRPPRRAPPATSRAPATPTDRPGSISSRRSHSRATREARAMPSPSVASASWTARRSTSGCACGDASAASTSHCAVAASSDRSASAARFVNAAGCTGSRASASRHAAAAPARLPRAARTSAPLGRQEHGSPPDAACPDCTRGERRVELALRAERLREQRVEARAREGAAAMAALSRRSASRGCPVTELERGERLDELDVQRDGAVVGLHVLERAREGAHRRRGELRVEPAGPSPPRARSTRGARPRTAPAGASPMARPRCSIAARRSCGPPRSGSCSAQRSARSTLSSGSHSSSRSAAERADLPAEPLAELLERAHQRRARVRRRRACASTRARSRRRARRTRAAGWSRDRRPAARTHPSARPTRPAASPRAPRCPSTRPAARTPRPATARPPGGSFFLRAVELRDGEPSAVEVRRRCASAPPDRAPDPAPRRARRTG